MAKTGYLVIVYQDINPSSPTYNQTREERTQDETVCPYRADAKWIEDTKYCELSDGMYTGYEITVYRDVEPLSSTYNQTREEKVLNTTDCEVDETTAEWQNIGDPYCRQTVYMPGGLMDNDGYIVQQQQDVNEYSETYGEIRENATLDTENCPLPNTEPVWQIISESCHVVTHDGQLVYDGTKDVVRVNTNRYSSTWNNNIPETANVEDEENCPPFIETQYRWVAIDGQYECVGYDKYSVEKKQQSKDGGTTWTDVSPTETRTGSVIESDSADCGYIAPQYRWVVTGTYVCVGYDKHEQEKQQVSYDGGSTWEDTENTRTGSLVEANSEYCGYSPTVEYRWVAIEGSFMCSGYDKYAIEKKQQSIDGGEWTDVVPEETRTGSLIESDSADCGYVEPQYRWVVIEGSFVCSGYDKYAIEKQQVSYDGGTTWADTEEPTRTGSLIESDSSDCGYVPPTPVNPYASQYLTIESLEDDNEIYLSPSGFSAQTVYISTDEGLTWTSILANNLTVLATLNKNEKMLIKANNEAYSSSNTKYTHFQIKKLFNVSGNIMSLIYGDDFIGKTALNSSYTFYNLFNTQIVYDGVNGTLVSAENLVLPGISESCYQNLFYGERRLTKAPALSATTLANYCYSNMFYNCTSLVNAPELPATTLANSCYSGMFRGCTSLTKAPELPATTLATSCYTSMFYGCTSLNYIKAMFTTTPGTNYTSNWVKNVASTGTFVKNSAATWTTTGVHGIPSGWTVQTASE